MARKKLLGQDLIDSKERRLAQSRIRSKRYYLKNRERRIKETWENEKKRQKEFEEWKSTLKCTYCDENHVSCLDFHHTNPEDKFKGISVIRGSIHRLKEELKKCIVVCSNCHKKLHWAEKKGINFPFNL